MAFQLLQNMASDHAKVKKCTGHVIYMATPSHATENVISSINLTLIVQDSGACAKSHKL